MIIQTADLVEETTASTGQGPFVLAGPIGGSRAFSDAWPTATSLIAYCVRDPINVTTGVRGPNRLIALGTLTISSGVASLSVDTVLGSSAGLIAPVFGAGAKDIYSTAPAAVFQSLQFGDPISGCTYNGSGQLTSYTQGGVTYTLTYAGGLLATKAGGGVTITYVYVSGLLDHEVYSVSGAAPVNSVVPTITGTAQVGQTLTASTGTWSNSPTSYAYQWSGNGTPISGATASTYVPVTGDIGHTLTVAVIASNSSGAGSAATSTATGAVIAAGAVPVNSVIPAVSGTAQVGQTLTSTTGTWSNSPTSYAYQWKVNGVNVGTNANTYVPVTGDIGYIVVCQVTATNGSGSGTPATSTATSAVIAAGSVPVNSVAPVISGTATVGSTLTSTTGTWSNSPTGYTYQWKRGGTNISGATASTYVLVTADGGTTATCAVTASNGSGGGTPATSNGIAVAGVPVNSVAPAITGTAQVGQTLTCSTGTWSNSPTSYAYQWKGTGGANISGATASTYVPVTGDIGVALNCQVTASNSAGAGSPVVSAATAAVIAAGPTNQIVRFDVINDTSKIIESGDGTAGWNYAGNGTSGDIYDAFAQCTSLSLPASTDGYIECTLAEIAAGSNGVIIGLGTSNTNNAYANWQYCINAAIGVVYQCYALGVAAGSPSFANGIASDKVRLQRTGTSLVAKFSQDGGTTFTTVNTFTVSATEHLFLKGTVYDNGKMSNMRGGGLS